MTGCIKCNELIGSIRDGCRKWLENEEDTNLFHCNVSWLCHRRIDGSYFNQ